MGMFTETDTAKIEISHVSVLASALDASAHHPALKFRSTSSTNLN
jgi:hypothetical protein